MYIIYIICIDNIVLIKQTKMCIHENVLRIDNMMVTRPYER